MRNLLFIFFVVAIFYVVNPLQYLNFQAFEGNSAEQEATKSDTAPRVEGSDNCDTSAWLYALHEACKAACGNCMFVTREQTNSDFSCRKCADIDEYIDDSY